jgi:hypothetical protein
LDEDEGNTTYSRKDFNPFTATIQKKPHPCGLLRVLGLRGGSGGGCIVVIVCQHPHLPKLDQEFVTCT